MWRSGIRTPRCQPTWWQFPLRPSIEFRANKARVKGGHQRTAFGYFIKFITGNPVMPVVSLAAVVFFVITTFQYFGQNNKGVEFFVATEP